MSRLGPFLCWAVVFADLGTSVYYTPGILFGSYGRLAGFFVILTLVVFVLLTLKYVEVSARFPEGGGVVTVSSRAIGPWAGALGGMLILVDYFLTASLSSLSGLTYLDVVLPGIKPVVIWATIGVLIVLGVLNWYGIRESAVVSAVIAVIAMLSDLIVLVYVFVRVPLGTIGATFTGMFHGEHLTPLTLVTGYAGAFLAFSGLESISQLSPVMRVPRRKVAGAAMGLAIVTVGITSPLLTVFSTNLVCAHSVVAQGVRSCVSPTGAAVDPNQFISALGGQFGGVWLGVLVAISASTLLVFASNTAIIGSYHVFLALTRMRFFPPIVAKQNRLRGTPHISIILATGIPVAILAVSGIVASGGVITLLGDMYAFGLLGAFTLTSVGLDIVRWRERQHHVHVGPTPEEEAAEEAVQARNDAAALQHEPAWRRTLRERQLLLVGQVSRATEPLQARWQRVSRATEPLRARMRGFSHAEGDQPKNRATGNIVLFLGFFTTVCVAVGWGTNIVNKPLATEFGGVVTLIGLAVAWINHHRQVRAGTPAVHPMYVLNPVPRSILVVLPVGSSEAARQAREAVVQAAVEHAEQRTLVLLYLAPSAITVTPRMLEITDPYARDLDAQRAMSEAESIILRLGGLRRAPGTVSFFTRALNAVLRLVGKQTIPHFYIYRTGKIEDLPTVWGVVRPDITVGQAKQNLSKVVQTAYVRYYVADGVRVAFYVSHPPVGASRPTPPIANGAPTPRRETSGNGPTGAAPAGAAPAEPRPPQLVQTPRVPEDASRAASNGAEERARPEPSEYPSPEVLEDADQYIWTGTDLKRRDEVAPDAGDAPDEHADRAEQTPER